MELKKDKNGKVVDKPYFRKMFKEEMGEPDTILPVDRALLDKYTGVLPDELLLHWKLYGLTSFKNGLFWFTNPDEYCDLVEDYLSNTPLANRTKISVIARSAFGELYLWEEGKGKISTVVLISNIVSLSASKNRNSILNVEEEYEMNRFIGVQYLGLLDRNDASNKPLFERALKKLGPLKSNEMYGYKLLPALGGK